MNDKDRRRLRRLAKERIEIARGEKMQKLYADWRAHGDFLPGSRPMVLIETASFAHEILPPLLQCEDEGARGVEAQLISGMINHTLFDDDTLVRDYFEIYPSVRFDPFGIEVIKEHAELDGKESVGHHFVTQISDIKEDFHKFGKSSFAATIEGALSCREWVGDIIGDVLEPRLSTYGHVAVLTQNLVHLMSMQDMFMSMYDHPGEFKAIMERQTDDYLELYENMEKDGLLGPQTQDQPVAQGSYCFNDVLPDDKDSYTLKDNWLYMDSQESVGISPDMFGEFIFPYYKKLAERFGSVSYGCCEPVDPFYDSYLSRLDNLRKISISAWCNEEIMGERLRGRKISYLRKPSPNFLGLGGSLDEDAVRKHISRTVNAASGCNLEIIQRDVLTVDGSPKKVRRYVELIRECCDNYRP